jgi:uncharacterized protein YcbX
VSLRVAEIWRYPVKSLQGQRVDRTDVDRSGLVGDRQFAIIDVETGLGLTGRRVPGLLFATATWNDNGNVRITLPDGTVSCDDATLSTWLHRPVALRHCQDVADRRYEDVVNFEAEPTSAWKTFEGASGPFHDSPWARVSLVSTQTIGELDRRRFRPNIVLAGAGEDDLVGCRVRVGSAVMTIRGTIQRCVMVTRPQPGGIQRDLDVLKTINRHRLGRLAVGATIDIPGTVTVGDKVTIVAQSER